ncbi:MAG: hypothetical protein Q9227_000702 [Pyrenula ochraceoflavens]
MGQVFFFETEFHLQCEGKIHDATNIEYTKDTSEPDVLEPFLEVQPLYKNMVKPTTLNALATDIQKLQAAPTRQTFCTTSFKTLLQHLHDVVEIFQNHVATVEYSQDFKVTLTYQRLHQAIPQHSIESGGNAMGLPADLPPLVLAILTCSCSQPSDDEAMNIMAQAFIKEVDTSSVPNGLYYPYIYPKYAGSFQKPLMNLPQNQQQTLRAISLKYDPSQFFQKRVLGAFKITAYG